MSYRIELTASLRSTIVFLVTIYHFISYRILTHWRTMKTSTPIRLTIVFSGENLPCHSVFIELSLFGKQCRPRFRFGCQLFFSGDNLPCYIVFIELSLLGEQCRLRFRFGWQLLFGLQSTMSYHTEMSPLGEHCRPQLRFGWQFFFGWPSTT